ncbi:COG1470 family protein [Infirmifilum sp. NZ]|uniref:COG1470 family protein n=1 Tax=Infirmifilum sp. NZ TaxID=2926850 RepID=UPI0027A90175|nr:DUF4139 domain-containing protein [Infirmifilum sp. NZ]UNQ73395.1 DUF4139 domain-containing protein [Infirmifilum sp. NZ]
MSFTDRLRRYLELKRRIREELGLILKSSVYDLVEIFAEEPEKLERYQTSWKKLKEEVPSSSLHRNHEQELLALLREVEAKLKRVAQLLEAKPEVEVGYSSGEVVVYPGDEATLRVLVRNPYWRRATVDVRVEAGGGVEFDRGKVYEGRVELAPGEEKSLTLKVKGLSPGVTSLKSVSVKAVFEGGEEFSKSFEGVKIIVKKLPEIKVERKVERGAVNGVDGYRVTVTVENRSDDYVELRARESLPQDLLLQPGVEVGWQGRLGPGEKATYEYFLKAPPEELELPPVVIEVLLGTSIKPYQFDSTIVKLKPLKPAGEGKPTLAEHGKVEGKEEGVVEERASQLEFSPENLMSELAKAGVSAFLGYVIGSGFVPEIKRMPKQVFIHQDLRWSTRKIGDEEVTVIFEDPETVVVEDREDFIQIRPATVSEIVASTTAKLAWILEREFINWVIGSSKNLEEMGRVKVEEPKPLFNLSEFKKELEKTGVPVDEQRLKELPSNLYTVITVGGGVLRKATVKVYVFSLARVSELYRNLVDHRPLSLAEAREMIKGINVEDAEENIIIFASPTGWDSPSTTEAKRDPNPHKHTVLVDLKTGELFYNAAKPLLKTLVDTIFTGFSLTAAPIESEDVDKYASLLLRGVIDEKSFLEEVLKHAKTARKAESSGEKVLEEG